MFWVMTTGAAHLIVAGQAGVKIELFSQFHLGLGEWVVGRNFEWFQACRHLQVEDFLS